MALPLIPLARRSFSKSVSICDESTPKFLLIDSFLHDLVALRGAMTVVTPPGIPLA